MKNIWHDDDTRPIGDVDSRARAILEKFSSVETFAETEDVAERVLFRESMRLITAGHAEALKKRAYSVKVAYDPTHVPLYLRATFLSCFSYFMEGFTLCMREGDLTETERQKTVALFNAIGQATITRMQNTPKAEREKMYQKWVAPLDSISDDMWGKKEEKE